MTSGEVTHGFLTRTARRVVGQAKREDAEFDEMDASSEALRTVAAAMKRGIESRDTGRAKCAHVTWNERGAITLGKEFSEWIEIVDETSEEFDFVLIHGTEAFGRGDDRDCVSVDVERIKEFIERVAREGKAPLVIANPDFVTVSGDALVTMPGTLAKWYAEMCDDDAAEGMVALMGKPDAIIYKALLGKIGRESGAVIAVGDSMEHDVAGARRAGIDALFICGGIHAAELSDESAGDDGQRLRETALRALYDAHDSTPRYASWRLEW
jgi:ribonucleotide monophosphatase NagD (HAD superfamily)